MEFYFKVGRHWYWLTIFKLVPAGTFRTTQLVRNPASWYSMKWYFRVEHYTKYPWVSLRRYMS